MKNFIVLYGQLPLSLEELQTDGILRTISFGAMFYRYISENITNYINAGEFEAGNTDFDYAQMPDNAAEAARTGLVEEKGFFIFPSHLFCNVRAKAKDDENLNETLEKVFRCTEESAKGTLPCRRFRNGTSWLLRFTSARTKNCSTLFLIRRMRLKPMLVCLSTGGNYRSQGK